MLGDILRFRLEWEQKPQKVNCRRVHALNSCPLFNSSRTQKIISLCSCEAELHEKVFSVSDGIYIRAVLDFALGTQVDHCIFADSSSARQLVTKRGVGKVRRLSAGSKQGPDQEAGQISESVG